MSDEQISIEVEEFDLASDYEWDGEDKSGNPKKYYTYVRVTPYDIRVENGVAICYASDDSEEVSAYIHRPDISTLDDLRKTVAGLLERMKDRVMRLRELEVAVWKATELMVIMCDEQDEDEDEDEEEST